MADSGEFTFTDGTLATLALGERVTATMGTNAMMTYGIKTDIMMGAASAFTAGPKTTVDLTTSFGFTASVAYSLAKIETIQANKASDTFSSDSWVAKVGTANSSDKAKRMTLEGLAYVMMVTQASIALASAGMIGKLMDEGKKAAEGKGSSTLIPGVSRLNTAYTGVASLTGALALLGARLLGLGQKTTPAAVLSMNAVGAAYMGLGGGNTASVGVTVNKAGLDLTATTQDLGLSMVEDDTTVLGFQRQPTQQEGAHLHMSTNGLTTLVTKKMSTHVEELSQLQADEILLLNSSASSKVNIDADGSYLAAGKAILAIKTDDSITATVDAKQALSINGSGSKLAASGGSVECDQDKLTLTGNGNAIVIDSTGCKIAGDAIQVLAPGAPKLASWIATQQDANDKKDKEISELKKAMENAAKSDGLRAEAIKQTNLALSEVQTKIRDLEIKMTSAPKTEAKG